MYVRAVCKYIYLDLRVLCFLHLRMSVHAYLYA